MASPQSTPDYYEILELEQDATVEQIRESYKRLALKLHPDRNLSPDATAQFQLV
jgi:curved DNA-binding protein CbpA